MDELKIECEKSFYRELYPLPEKGQGIVIDETTRRIYLKKTLTIWQEEVLVYLRDHQSPFVPKVQTFWPMEDGTLILIEEYVQGKTLTELLMTSVVTEEKRREIFLGVTEAVSFLHRAVPPIIHRDIKPDNIMITTEGVKLVDYDAAKIHRGGRDRDTVLLGTQGSAAPEQYGFAESDVRTDVYGLGMLLKTLFPNDPEILSVAEKATSMDPADRYQSADSLRKAFLRTGSGSSSRVPFGRSGAFRSRGSRRQAADAERARGRGKAGKGPGRWAWIAAFSAGIAAAVLVGFFSGRGSLGEKEERLLPGAEQSADLPEGTAEESGREAEAAAEAPSSEKQDAYDRAKAIEAEARETLQDLPALLAMSEDGKASEGELPAELLDSGYQIVPPKKNNTYGHVSYVVQIRNPNPETAIDDLYLDAVLRKADGTVLQSNEIEIAQVASGDTIYVADDWIYDSETPDYAEISLRTSSARYYSQKEAVFVTSKDLPISHTLMTKHDSGEVVFTGDITNVGETELSRAVVVVVYRKNGKLVGGVRRVIEDLQTGSARAFEISTFTDADYDSYELYGIPWQK